MPLPIVPIIAGAVAGAAAAYGAKKALESSKKENAAETADRTEKERWMSAEEALNYLRTKLEQRTSERLSPLLERGINARDGDGKTALMHATSPLTQPATSLQSLIEAGADVNARDNDSTTALMHAARMFGSIGAIKPLLDAGADVHARDKDGKTALMQLAQRYIPASNPILEPEEVQEQVAQTNAAIKLLLDAGADVNARDNDGETALMHTADLFGNIHAIQPLLEAGADVNARDSNGKTTLMRLMHRNFGSFEPDEGPSEITQTKAAIKLLLDAGADVNATDKDGWTALHWSFSIFGNLAASTLLLEAGANVNAATKDGETVLMRLGSYGNELESNEKVIRIIAQYCFGIEASEEAGVSYTAVQQELSAKLIKLLLDAGANIDASDKDGRTALHYATGSSLFPNTYAIKPLLEAGANINARDNEGRTPLLGFFCSDDKIKQLLIEAGADVNAADNKGRTALMGASAEATKLLLSAGANANAVAYDGRTALMGADAETAKLLINAGINIHATTSKGVNALMCAGSAETARLLMDAGINIHATDSEGETALMRNLRPEKTALLIEAGLDVNAASNNGCTALMRASGAEIDKYANDDGSTTLIPRGNAETVKVLLDAGAHVNTADNEGKTALMHNINAIAIIASEAIDETKSERWIEHEKQRKAERIEHFSAITRLLLDAGANPNAADNDGKTALTLAQETGLDDVIKPLHSAGAKD